MSALRSHQPDFRSPSEHAYVCLSGQRLHSRLEPREQSLPPRDTQWEEGSQGAESQGPPSSPGSLGFPPLMAGLAHPCIGVLRTPPPAQVCTHPEFRSHLWLTQVYPFHAEREGVAAYQLTPGDPRCQANPQSGHATPLSVPRSLLPLSPVLPGWELSEPSDQPTGPSRSYPDLAQGPHSSSYEPEACSSLFTPEATIPLGLAAQCGASSSFLPLLPNPFPSASPILLKLWAPQDFRHPQVQPLHYSNSEGLPLAHPCQTHHPRRLTKQEGEFIIGAIQT